MAFRAGFLEEEEEEWGWVEAGNHRAQKGKRKALVPTLILTPERVWGERP